MHSRCAHSLDPNLVYTQFMVKKRGETRGEDLPLFFGKDLNQHFFSSYEKDTIRLKFYSKTFQCAPFPILEDLFEEEQKV